MNVRKLDPGPIRPASGLPLAGLLFAALPFLGGCVLQEQHLRELAERDDQIRSLQEERTTLKSQLRDLEYQRDSLETSLIDANSRATAAPSSSSPQENPASFAELDSIGVGYGRNAAGEPMLTIPAEITFASGKAELSTKGRSALDTVAKTLKREYPESTYWIEGHTDSDPIKHSSFGTNRDLSLARAMAVLHYFVESGAITDDRCVVVGHGQYQPLVAETGPAGKAKNRRVEIVVRRP